ncbi:MAG: gliding motility-associated C-terminal domain-containing protein, partial [Bacteroidales bacterium]
LGGSITDQTNVACAGESTGSVTVAGSGGTPPYEYSLGGGAYQSSGTFNNLPAGNDTVTVRDTNLCTFDVPLTITEPATALGGSITDQTNVACAGESTGSVTVDGSGGTPPYEYSLGGGAYQSSGTFGSLPAGNDTVTVRDAILCTFDVPLTITEPATALGGNITDQTNVACTGESTGSVTVAGSGGTPPYEYSLGGGAYQSSSTFNNLSAGNDTVTVRDVNLCTFDIPVSIIEPATALGGSITDQTDLTCSGDSTGSVTVAGSGGTPPYEYSLDGGAYQSSGTFGSLPEGTFTVTVRDANLCTFDVPVTITGPASVLTATITGQVNVACYGNATGSVTVAGSDGVEPYEYSLDGGAYQSSGTFGSLTAGTYTVTVRDANLCTFDLPVTITQPAGELEGAITEQLNACFGTSSGSVTVNGINGTPPYEYSLDGGPFQTGGTFSGLAPDSYTITVRDVNLCTAIVNLVITEAGSALSGSITDITDVACLGEATGSITVAGSEGTPPYEYSLDGGTYQPSTTFSNLFAGDYLVTVRDANHCTYDIPVTLTEPLSAVSGSIVNQIDISCFGDATGEVTLAGSGGVPPYEYSLDGGTYQVSGIFTGLAGNDYIATIRDSNKCTVDIPFTLAEPEPISINPQITSATCIGDEDGSIVLNVTGGTLPYTFLWSNSAVTENLNNIDGGTYIVEIIDAASCTLIDTVTVPFSGDDCLLIPNAFIPNNDGMNDTWRIRDIESFPDATVHIYSRWGQLVYSAENGYQDPWDGTFKGKELPMDTYFYIIDLKNGQKPLTGQVTIIR